MPKRNIYYPPNQLRVQRRRCHIHYTHNFLPQCLIFMKLYLLFWCQQLFLLERIENQLQVFMSGISMWCNERDDNLPYSNNSFCLPFFLLDIRAPLGVRAQPWILSKKVCVCVSSTSEDGVYALYSVWHFMLEKVCRIMEAIVPQASSHLFFATSTSKDGVYTFSYFLTFYGNKSL